MILTVTLNVALDVTYTVRELRPHATHRVTRVDRRAGGKGVNVSRVLAALGHPTLATGFAGGTTGEAIRRDLTASGVDHRLVALRESESRATMTLVDEHAGEATVFNEAGPVLDEQDWRAFRAAYDELAEHAEVVVMSGSLPPGLPEDAYAQLCAATPGETLVDAGGSALVAAARAGADVLLPNRDELGEATGCSDVAEGARRLLAEGARAVVVSCGGDGLFALTPEGAWSAPAPERLRGNPTGAGDALAAAIAATHGAAWPQRLREALAWSAAAVTMPLAGEVDLEVLARVRAAAAVEEREDSHVTGSNR